MKAVLVLAAAMSFGALSAVAIEALNKGAKLGNFAHDTGEGGLSAHHLSGGGDLIWEIGCLGRATKKVCWASPFIPTMRPTASSLCPILPQDRTVSYCQTER